MTEVTVAFGNMGTGVLAGFNDLFDVYPEDWGK